MGQRIYRTIKDKEHLYNRYSKGITDDNRISAKAKGILIQILSNANHWQIHPSELARHFSDGPGSIKSGLEELVNAGYIHKKPGDKVKGRFQADEYYIYESPKINPHYSNQSIDNTQNESDHVESEDKNTESPAWKSQHGESKADFPNRSNQVGNLQVTITKVTTTNKTTTNERINKEELHSNKETAKQYNIKSIDDLDGIDDSEYLINKKLILDSILDYFLGGIIKKYYSPGSSQYEFIANHIKTDLSSIAKISSLKAKVSSYSQHYILNSLILNLRDKGFLK